MMYVKKVLIFGRLQSFPVSA